MQNQLGSPEVHLLLVSCSTLLHTAFSTQRLKQPSPGTALLPCPQLASTSANDLPFPIKRQQAEVTPSSQLLAPLKPFSVGFSGQAICCNSACGAPQAHRPVEKELV